MGKEQPGVEFKAGGSRNDRQFLGRVLRGIMAMANRRNGGFVIVGVSEAEEGLLASGFNASDASTWLDSGLADSLTEYADPTPQQTAYSLSVNGAQVVAVEVEEFSDLPIVCRKDLNDQQGHAILRQGACYVRPRRKPESVAVGTLIDMRDLLDLAIEKGMTRSLAQAERIGLLGNGSSKQSDRARFDEELHDFV